MTTWMLAAGLVGLPAAARASELPQSAPQAASQQQVDELKAQLEQLKQQMAALEARLAALAAAPQAPPTPAPTPVPEPPPQPQPMPAGGGRVFNPDTSVIANFVGFAGKNPVETSPALQLSEVETSFQAVVDPYARADFFLAASPEGLEIEEGYITFTTLPAGLLLKAGKMRAQFGKVNTQHTHALPYADRPLVTQNLLGGEEGLSDAGLSLSKLIASPALYLEATGEVFGGANDVFESDRRGRLNYVGRLRAYRDITEGSNIDLGASVAYGPTADGPEATKTLYGLDATFRYRPLRRAIYRRFQARTELMWSRPAGSLAGAPTAFGWYGLAEYQFARRWYSGVRFDQSATLVDPSLKDNGQSVFITFWPSEFSQIRGQLRRTKYGTGELAREFLFQFNFSIGAHGAHIF
jgi:hypothetical protein